MPNTCLPLGIPSIKMPASFLPPAKTSFGQCKPSGPVGMLGRTASTIATAVASEING